MATQQVTRRQVQKAFRKLALRWHPDRVTDPGEKARAEEYFKRLTVAAEVSLKLVRWLVWFARTPGLNTLCFCACELIFYEHDRVRAQVASGRAAASPSAGRTQHSSDFRRGAGQYRTHYYQQQPKVDRKVLVRRILTTSLFGLPLMIGLAFGDTIIRHVFDHHNEERAIAHVAQSQRGKS